MIYSACCRGSEMSLAAYYEKEILVSGSDDKNGLLEAMNWYC